MSHLPYFLPLELPGDDVVIPDGWTAPEGTGLVYIESHCEEGKKLFISEFREKPRLAGFLCALLGDAGAQEIEDVLWQVMVGRTLDHAIGDQLDGIGQVVDLARAGWEDETYRTLLRAQILVLRSKGTWPELIAILTTVGIDVTLALLYEHPPAAGRIVLGAPLPTEVTGAEVFDLLRRAKPGGVRLELEFPIAAVAETFMWADADVEQADTARGWADDGSTLGGYWADEHASTESL